MTVRCAHGNRINGGGNNPTRRSLTPSALLHGNIELSLLCHKMKRDQLGLGIASAHYWIWPEAWYPALRPAFLRYEESDNCFLWQYTTIHSIPWIALASEKQSTQRSESWRSRLQNSVCGANCLKRHIWRERNELGLLERELSRRKYPIHQRYSYYPWRARSTNWQVWNKQKKGLFVNLRASFLHTNRYQ